MSINYVPKHHPDEGCEETFCDICRGVIVKWPFEHRPAREVQQRALERGYGKSGFAYFMRMRLGKTAVALAEFSLYRENGELDWLIVICPNSLKQQWQDECEQCGIMVPIHLYSSQRKSAAQKWFQKVRRYGGGILCINYESVASFMDSYMHKQYNPERAMIVADESTNIKNPSTKMAKHAIKLAALHRYARVLTGKPTANSNADLWSQLKFINSVPEDRWSDAPMNFGSFKNTFTVSGGWMGKQVVDNRNNEELKSHLLSCSYIADDKYIQGFDKIYMPLREVKMAPEQAEMYKEMEKEFILELQNAELAGIKVTAPIVLTKYLRLQQITSGVIGDDERNQHNVIPPERNPRIREVLNIIENEIDNKVIIVCRFLKSIENLKKMIPDAVVLKGGMTDDQIKEVKDKFNRTWLGADVMIAQLQTLKFGHTLCAEDDKPADAMIFFENDFSLINRAQCESRPEKMNRKSTIAYFDFYSSKMDRIMINALRKKEEGAMKLMGYSREHGVLVEPTETDGGVFDEIFGKS